MLNNKFVKNSNCNQHVLACTGIHLHVSRNYLNYLTFINNYVHVREIDVCRCLYTYLINFTATRNFDELLSLSVYCRDRINPYMFVYALSVVMLHRPDTRNLELPSHAEMFPGLYMDSSVFSRAREESVVVQPGSRVNIYMFFTIK